jgi:hypothetical protein
MAFACFGWVTFLSIPLVNYLSPYNLASAILAELSLMLWLLAMALHPLLSVLAHHKESRASKPSNNQYKRQQKLGAESRFASHVSKVMPIRQIVGRGPCRIQMET